jgi:CRISPR/Cas system CSM-associated protein Csm5 (group 7 of RAMP superfamily)
LALKVNQVINQYLEDEKMKSKSIQEEEKRYLAAKIAREQAEQEEKKAAERLKKKQNQGDIIEQVKAKDKDKRRTEQEKMYEKRSAMLAEIEYQKKIDLEKEKTKKEVQTLKSTKGMANYAAKPK